MFIGGLEEEYDLYRNMAGIKSLGGIGVSYERAVATYLVIALLAQVRPSPFSNHPIVKIQLQDAESTPGFDDIVIYFESGSKVKVQAKHEIGKPTSVFKDCFEAFFSEWSGLSVIERAKCHWTIATERLNFELDSALAVLQNIAQHSISESDFVAKLIRETGAKTLYSRLSNYVTDLGGTNADLWKSLSCFSVKKVEVLNDTSLLNSRIIDILIAAYGEAPNDLLREIKDIVQDGAAWGATYTIEDVEEKLSRGRFSSIRNLNDPLSHPFALEEYERGIDIILSEGLRSHSYESHARLSEKYIGIRSTLAINDKLADEDHIGHAFARSTLYKMGRLCILLNSKKLIFDWLEQADYYKPRTSFEYYIWSRITILSGETIDKYHDGLDDAELTILQASSALDHKDYGRAQSILGKISGNYTLPISIIDYESKLRLYLDGKEDCDTVLSALEHVLEHHKVERPVLCSVLSMNLCQVFLITTSPAYRGDHKSDYRKLYQHMQQGVSESASLIEQGVGVHEAILLTTAYAHVRQIFGGVLAAVDWECFPQISEYVKHCDSSLFENFAARISTIRSSEVEILLKSFLQRNDLSERQIAFVTALVKSPEQPSLEASGQVADAVAWSEYRRRLYTSSPMPLDVLNGPFLLIEKAILAVKGYDVQKTEEIIDDLLVKWPCVITLLEAYIRETDSHLMQLNDEGGPMETKIFDRHLPVNRYAMSRAKVLARLYGLTNDDRYLGKYISELFSTGKADELRALSNCISVHQTGWRGLVDGFVAYLEGEFGTALASLRTVVQNSAVSDVVILIFDQLRYKQNWFYELAGEFEERLIANVPLANMYYPVLALAQSGRRDVALSYIDQVLEGRADPEAKFFAFDVLSRLGDYNRLFALSVADRTSDSPCLAFEQFELSKVGMTFRLNASLNRELADSIEQSRIPLAAIPIDPLRTFHAARAMPRGLSVRRVDGVPGSRSTNNIKELIVDPSVVFTLDAIELGPSDVAPDLQLYLFSSHKYVLKEWEKRCSVEASRHEWYSDQLEVVCSSPIWADPYEDLGPQEHKDDQSELEREAALRSQLGALSIHEGDDSDTNTAMGLVNLLTSEGRLSLREQNRMRLAYNGSPYEVTTITSTGGKAPDRILLSLSSALLLAKANLFEKISALGIKVFWSPTTEFERALIYREPLTWRQLSKDHSRIAEVVESLSVTESGRAPNSTSEAVQGFIADLKQWCTSDDRCLWTDDWALVRLVATECPGIQTVSTPDLIDRAASVGVSPDQTQAWNLELHMAGLRGTRSTSLLCDATPSQIEVTALRLGNLLRPEASNSDSEHAHHLQLVRENLSNWLQKILSADAANLGNQIENVARLVAQGADGYENIAQFYQSAAIIRAAGIYHQRFELGMRKAKKTVKPRILDPRKYNVSGIILNNF